ncbi:META domain-containing protein [Erwinia pyrifoliae]|uniref:META domain-containing protein n=1 Tax=Erwinia pyrifoliae TaxID=79967 RepID=A0ABY5XEI6_ERWPY|nr:META domain-containing protein [Erwinia pyrifoliae]MCT2387364.1 META domain-containing protein [Erwinia pyrifoliae]UWS35299.1 META domain-containing protein [Erwinia pyrifoliae]
MKKSSLLMLAAVAVSGCSGNAAQSDSALLANRMFVLSAVDGNAVTLRDGIKPGIGFNAGLKVSGVMCNRFFGQGKLEKGQLKVPQLASTRMMCNDPLLNQWEQTLSTVLMNGAAVKVTAQSLTLTGSGHSLEYKVQAQP